MLFERICRENGIKQRLTKPGSPTTVSLDAVGERAAALDCWRRAVARFDVYDYPRAADIRDRIHDLDQPMHRESQSGG